MNMEILKFKTLEDLLELTKDVHPNVFIKCDLTKELEEDNFHFVTGFMELCDTDGLLTCYDKESYPINMESFRNIDIDKKLEILDLDTVIFENNLCVLVSQDIDRIKVYETILDNMGI